MTRLAELRTMRDFIDREIAIELGQHGDLEAVQAKAIENSATLYEVSVEDILGASRVHRVCRARHGAAWLLKRGGTSCVSIAQILGYSDHTTAAYAVRKVDRDPATRALLLGLEVVA